jgi:hypothetical protein
MLQAIVANFDFFLGEKTLKKLNWQFKKNKMTRICDIISLFKIFFKKWKKNLKLK